MCVPTPLRACACATQWSAETIPYALKLLGYAAGQGPANFTCERALPKVETTAVPATLQALQDRCGQRCRSPVACSRDPLGWLGRQQRGRQLTLPCP